MEKVLIDQFIVPEESVPAFLERTRQVQALLKTLPGFVEGFVYQKTAGQSGFNIVTTAVWECETALERTPRRQLPGLHEKSASIRRRS